MKRNEEFVFWTPTPPFPISVMPPRRRRTAQPPSPLNGAPSPPWSDLPSDVLHHIAFHLTGFLDYLSFRRVCSSWRSAAPLLPLLLLPLPFHGGSRSNYTSATGVTTATVFHPLRDPALLRTISIRLPERRRVHSVCGSSHGSLILITDERTFVQVALFNPVTRSIIVLPPLGGLQRNFINKVVISSNPSIAQPPALVAVWASDKLAFTRVGDDAWSPPIDVGIDSLFGEFTYHRGKFFFIDDNQLNVKVIDAESQETVILDLPFSEAFDSNLSLHYRRKLLSCHMVQSFDDLFLITRNKEHHTLVFFKLNRNGEMSWLQVEEENIGDLAFFLSDKQSFAVNSPGVIGCKAKCVYFANTEFSMDNRPDFARVPTVHLRETTSDNVTRWHSNYWQAPCAQWTDWKNATGITWFLPSSQ